MIFKFAPLPVAVVAAATAASAQYIPGLETPTDTADGFEQMLATACPIAVIGEPLPGFTKDHPEETATMLVSALPEKLATYVSSGPRARIMKIPNPGDDLYAVYDPDAALCTIIALTDPKPIKTKLINPLTKSDAWPKIENLAPEFTHGFVYDFAGVAKLDMKFALPPANGKPVIATISRSEPPEK